MVGDYSSIMHNDVCKIVPRREGKILIGSRCVDNIKEGDGESVEKCKSRFVAKGFSQVEGIDYDETFASIARYSSIKVILTILEQMG